MQWNLIDENRFGTRYFWRTFFLALTASESSLTVQVMLRVQVTSSYCSTVYMYDKILLAAQMSSVTSFCISS